MPTVKVNDITLYYEIYGEGQPVVLIAGLNSDHTLYQKLGIVARLAEKYQVVIFDNRGVGQTDKPDIPYSIEMLAEDTAGLLNALGIEEAHLLGTSMGGRVATALTLQHPRQVKSLILVSTVMKSLKGTPQTWSRLWMNFMLILPIVRGPNPYYAVVRQREASRSYDCMDRLHEIQVPTLILHGKQDKLAPYPLAEAMQRGIKDSKMLPFPGGHLFFILRQKQWIEAITDFLESLQTSDAAHSDNKALLRSLYEEALHQGNLEIVDTLFSPAFIDHSTPDQQSGPAGVKAYFREIRCGFPDIQVVLEDLIAEDDLLVARTTWRGTHLGTYEGHPPTGQTVTRTLIQIFRIHDQLIIEEWNEGAGLIEHDRTL